jgi:hypothetical protein
VAWIACAVAAGVLGCAPRQRVPLELSPLPVEVYLDGVRLENPPAELELRADRDHKLFVKRRGYQPELVVLESREVEGSPQLVPPVVRVRLERRADGAREVEIEEVGAGEDD